MQTLVIKDEQGRYLSYLNELEWRQEKGEQFIYANVYFQSEVFKISLDDEMVVERMDLGHLKDRELETGSLKND